MKQTHANVRFGLSRVLLLVLIAVMALSTVACGDNTDPETPATAKTFTFEVVAADGTTTTFTVTTEKETVGEALLDEGLIEGEEGPYGLYVKKVNGILADYDVDQTYWAFYINGAYGATGVDVTPVEDGATYAFKVEK